MKQKTILLLILILGCTATSIIAQEVNSKEQSSLDVLHPYVAKHGLSVEFFGSLSIGSLNYERLILKKPDYFINLKVGGGALIGPMVPHSLSLNLGKEHHYAEFGYQGTLGWNPKDDALGGESWNLGYIASAIAGYRYYYSGGFFKIYASVLYNPSGELLRFIPWGGVGVGYSFKGKQQK